MTTILNIFIIIVVSVTNVRNVQGEKMILKSMLKIILQRIVNLFGKCIMMSLPV